MKNPCEKQEIRLLSQISCCVATHSHSHLALHFVVVTGHTLPTAKTKFRRSGHRSHHAANRMKWYSTYALKRNKIDIICLSNNGRYTQVSSNFACIPFA